MLKERIRDDMKTAFKAGNQTVRGTLSMLLSVVQNRELEKRARLMKAGAMNEAVVADQSQLTDAEVLDVVGSEIKKRRESAATYEQGGRPELAEHERVEVATLMHYLPEQLIEDAVVVLITEAIAATGAATIKDVGVVMKVLAPKTKGMFDNARASELVRKALG